MIRGGTPEQYIREGKSAIKWTRLSRRFFAANAVRLQLYALQPRQFHAETGDAKDRAGVVAERACARS